MDDKKLKWYTLSSKMKINYKWKTLFSTYNFIEASVFASFLRWEHIKYMSWNKQMNDYMDLSLCYWKPSNMSDEIYDWWKNILSWYASFNSHWQLFLDEISQDQLTIINKIHDELEALTIWVMWINANQELNNELWEILSLKIFNDIDFNDLSSFYNRLFFENTWTGNEATVLEIDWVQVKVELDKSDEIPDWMIEKREEELWYEGTASLKKIMWFNPRGWQRYFLVSQKRFSYIVSCRRFWKSYLMSYLALRELLCKPWWAVTYCIPDFNQADQPYDYIESFIRDQPDKNLKFSRPNHLVRYWVWRWARKIVFVSAAGKMWGKSKKSTLLILDEAAEIPDKFYAEAFPTTSDSGGRIVSASTTSVEAPINWFYWNAKKWELWLRENYFTIRWNIFNNPNISEEEKITIKEEYSSLPAVFRQTERLWLFATNSKLFKSQNFWIHYSEYKKIQINYIDIVFKDTIEVMQQEYSQFIIWYDPAIKQDKWWVCVMWVKKRSFSSWWYLMSSNQFDLIWEAYVDAPDYWTQIDFLVHLKAYLGSSNWVSRKVSMALDYTGIGIWVYELMRIKWLDPMRVTSTSQKTPPKYEDWYWRVNKQDLESWFVAGMWDTIFWYSYLEKMKMEMEWYWIKLRWKDNHFDILSAAFLATFFWFKYIGSSWDNHVSQTSNPIEQLYSMSEVTNNVEESAWMKWWKKPIDRYRAWLLY